MHCDCTQKVIQLYLMLLLKILKRLDAGTQEKFIMFQIASENVKLRKKD